MIPLLNKILQRRFTERKWSKKLVYVFGGVLLLLMGIHQAMAQDIRPYDLEIQAKHAENKGYDPSYRVNYFENIIIRTFINSDVANFQYRTLNGDAEFNVVPVSEYLLGTSIDYKWLAIGVSFSPAFLQNRNDYDAIENSESLKLNLNFFYSDQLRQELSYTYLKGFLNTNDITAYSEDYRVLNNTTLAIFQGSTYFIANKNFSFRSHYAQTERQLRSAGSLIPKLTYTYSITNPNLPPLENGIETLRIRSFDLIGQIGYLYTFVYDQRWFATFGAHPGVGYNSTHYEFREESKRLFDNTNFAFDGEITLGYNAYRWFFGISGNWRNYNKLNNEAGQLSRDSEYIQWYLGYRFNDNKAMRTFFGWFEDHLGF